MSNVIGTLFLLSIDGEKTYIGDVTDFSFKPLELKLPEGDDCGIHCQNCFHTEALMQDDQGEYLCSECYVGKYYE